MVAAIQPQAPLADPLAVREALAPATDSETLLQLLAPMAAEGYSLRRKVEALAAPDKVVHQSKPLSASTVRTRLQRLGLSRRDPQEKVCCFRFLVFCFLLLDFGFFAFRFWILGFGIWDLGIFDLGFRLRGLDFYFLLS